MLNTLEGYLVAVLLAAFLGVLAERLGQPSVVAYVVTGLLVGPAFLEFAAASSLTDGLGELGLVFLLFVLGLEIEVGDLRRMLRPVFVGAFIHMALVGVFGFLLASLLGFSGLEAVVAALAVMFGSTAVAVKLLSDREMLSTLSGRLGVGLLLVEDLAVVVVLAVVSAGVSFSSLGVGVGRASLLSGVVVAVSLALSRLAPRFLGSTEIGNQRFVVYSSAWVLAFATLSQVLGVPAELGAFFAGVSLSGFPGSLEITERLRPLSNLFLAVFFVNVGLGVTASQLYSQLVPAALFSLLLVAFKLVSWLLVLRGLGFSSETSFRTSLSLSQVSEFALVLGGVAASQGLVGGGLVAFLAVSAVLTMTASAYAISSMDKLYRLSSDLLGRISWGSKTEAVKTLEGHAVVVGLDEFSRPALNLLEEEFDDVVVVDNDFKDMNELSSKHHEYVFGDLRHGEVRRAAGIESAEFVFCNVEDPELAKRVVEEAPQGTVVFVTSPGVESALELYDLGADFVPVINFLTAERLARHVERRLVSEPDEDLEEFNARLEMMDG